MARRPRQATFEGWRVVSAAFVLAIFGWGLGFYGPPVFLKVLQESRGWPIALISAAVTMHFLVGAYSGANIPALHRRFGAANVTRACCVAMAVGLSIWASATEPWHMFVASLLSGAFAWRAVVFFAVVGIGDTELQKHREERDRVYQ